MGELVKKREKQAMASYLKTEMIFFSMQIRRFVNKQINKEINLLS